MKNIFTITMFLVFYSVNAQVVVEAPTMETMLTKQTILQKSQFAKQIKEVIRQVEYLQDQAERVVKVNTFVKQGREAKKVIENTKEVYYLAAKQMRTIANAKGSYNAKINALEGLSNLVDDIHSINEDVKKLLFTKSFKMEDAQRLQILRQINQDLQKKKREISSSSRMTLEIDKMYKIYGL